MKNFGLVIASVLGLVLVYVAVHLALIEVGQEIVVLDKWTGDGEIRNTRLWIVEDETGTWLHHGYADSPWIRHLATDPILEIERDGERRRYRGTPDPDADPKVHGLLRARYGAADRLVRFWAGTHEETGFATRSRCQAIPIRLEATGREEVE